MAQNNHQLLLTFRSIFYPLMLKGLGMILSFVLIVLIIQKVGLEEFGKYSLVLSFLVFLSGVSSYGFAQTFIRHTVSMNFFEKRKSFVSMISIIFFTSLVLTPVLIGYLYWTDYFKFNEIVVITSTFLLMAGARLRFSLMRTTQHVRQADIPDQIIRPIAMIICIYLLPEMDGNVLYSSLFIGLLLALFVNISYCKSYYIKFSFVKKRSVNVFSGKDGKANKLMWLNNSLVLFKDFFELYIISLFFGEIFSGEYKVILQLYIVFMAVFNTMALVNSKRFASMVVLDDIKGINKKASLEMLQALKWLLLIVTAMIFVEYFYTISQFLKLSQSGKYAVLVFVFLSFLNIIIGPVSQLLLHSRSISSLILLTCSRMFGVFLILIILRHFNESDIFSISASIALSEALVLLLSVKLLQRKIQYKLPIFLLFRQ